MNKVKKITLLAVMLFAFSCKINGTFQGLYSYYNKTKSKEPELFVNHNTTENSHLNEMYKNKVVITDGKKLKTYITSGKTIVYIWAPKCRSAFCYPLNILQQACLNKNINLIVVAEYYDLNKMKNEYDLKNPIFGIDTDYYKTNLTSKYCSLFYDDLTDQKTVAKRILYFENGTYVNSYNTLNEIN